MMMIFRASSPKDGVCQCIYTDIIYTCNGRYIFNRYSVTDIGVVIAAVFDNLTISSLGFHNILIKGFYLEIISSVIDSV